MFSKFKKFTSRAKVAYLTSKDQRKTKENDITRMLDQFENFDQIKLTSITDVPTSEFRGLHGGSESASVIVSATKQEDGEIVNTPVLNVPAMEPMEKAVKLLRGLQNTRSAVSVHCHSVDCCSVFLLFLLCPEVVWFDVTSHSNNKGFILLTFFVGRPLIDKLCSCGCGFPTNSDSAFAGFSSLQCQNCYPYMLDSVSA